MFEQFKAYSKSMAEKIENALKFGGISKVNGSDGALQKIQVKTLRNIEDAFKVGQFGFNSNAPIGSRTVVAEISNQKIVIANEHIVSIIDISSGNTIIYNESGNYIKIEDDTITHFADSHIVNGTTQTVNANETVNGNEIINGNETVNGNFTVNGQGTGGESLINNTILAFDSNSDIIIDGISLRYFINSNYHGGVQSGGSNTSTPII